MNHLTIGQSLEGFTVVRARESEKLHGTLYEMVHQKTGAELVFVDNGAENKLFSVAFKTIPENSTGVFHILEHSVLCGSEKFPVREPFLELLKGSMNTFLNALTFPDKTVYPVSSRNEKDFLNLTEVYLDAVFAPLLLKNEQIFLQEGRHLELSEDGPFYNGVVLNEMKGAMSNVDRRISEGITGLLFPDSCYRYNSGGAPDVIPDLTYEKFVETYRRFYHPSNARFFLDGDLPLSKTLSLISQYLDQYEKAPLPAEIPLQIPRSGEATNYYESTEATGAHDILSFARLLGDFGDLTSVFAADVLCDVLASTNESPLKRALLSAGLCEDVELFIEDDVRQPYMALCVRNTNDEKAPEIKKVIRETLARLYKEGLSRDDLVASLNKMEFALREMEEPQGLARNLLSLRSWLYGGDPMLYLDTDGLLSDLRAMIPTGGYEKLLEKLFINEENIITLHTLPSETLTSEEEAAAKARAKKDLEAMDDAALTSLKAKNEALKLWQQTPDSPEALATLPALSLDDVDPTPRPFVTEESEVAGVKVLYHPAPAANGVTHLNLYLPLTVFSRDELLLLSVLPDLYGELPTADHDVNALQRAIKTHIGSFSVDSSVLSRYDDTKEATPVFALSASFLTPEAENAQSLIAEVLTSTDFTARDRVLEIVRQMDEANLRHMISGGHSLGAGVVRAMYSASGAAREALRGFSAMRAVHALALDFENQYPRLLALLERFTKEILGKKSLTVSVTAENPLDLEKFLARLPEGTEQPEKVSYQCPLPQKLGISIPAPVAYAVMGYHPMSAGKFPDSRLRVASNILSLAYLWSKVRVEGGAYGAGYTMLGNEGTAAYSYRDPSPLATLEIFKTMPDFLRAFAEGDEPIDKFIISTIASADPLLSPKSMGQSADALYFSGVDEALRAKNRRDMLSTDHASLLAWADALEGMKENNAVCVVAKEETLKSIEGLEIMTL